MCIMHGVFAMEIEQVASDKPNPQSILKDLKHESLSEEIAAQPAFDSVVQIVCMHSPDSSAGHDQTGLVIHPHGILSCAHGLRKDLIINVKTLNDTVMQAKLKYPVYIRKESSSQLEIINRDDKCLVYFYKKFYEEYMRETHNYSNKSSKKLSEQIYDMAIFWIETESYLNVVNYPRLDSYIHAGGYITCSFYNDLYGLKKQFSIIEDLLSRHEVGSFHATIALLFLQNISLDSEEKSYPALYRAVPGSSGSPIFVAINGKIHLIGLLNAWSDELEHNGKTSSYNIITPIKEFSLITNQFEGYVPIFTDLHRAFSEAVEKAYGYRITLL